MAAITVNEMIASLQKMVDKNPEVGNMPCVYSSDDEGNYFDYIYCFPVEGFYIDKDFYSEVNNGNRDRKVNSVCIN